MNTIKVLHLTLKKKWFDMILSGQKKEEYREIKPYWITRLKFDIWNTKPFDFIEFRNGYAKTAPTMIVECKGIRVDMPKPEWSENAKGVCFVIELGTIYVHPINLDNP